MLMRVGNFIASVLYQHGTLGTLMAGLLKGTASINGVQHGGFGVSLH